MRFKQLFILMTVTSSCFASIPFGYYVDIADELMTTPASAAMAGADLSIGNGSSVESTPGNLPFDSLNNLSLSYAGYYSNSFSTSMVTYTGHPRNDIGFSIMAGYIYIPDILDTRGSSATENGELGTAKISMFSASKIYFRAGMGRKFSISPNIALGAGVAFNAKRVRLPEVGYGLGLDGGLKAFFARPGISAALQIENLTSGYTVYDNKYRELAYVHLRAGLGWERNFDYLYGQLRLSYASPDLLANEGINDISYDLTENNNVIETVDQSKIYKKPVLLISQGRLGLEYTIMRTVAIRFGLTQGRLAFGAGLRMMHERAGLDFAYVTHALAGTYQVSVQYLW